MRLLVFSCVIAAALAGAAASQDAPPTPVQWSAVDAKATIKRGETAVVRVAAQIDEGWHLYSLERGPIPTTLTAAPAPPFSLNAKEIESPEPKRSQDPNFGVETAYYEDSAVFGLPIVVAKDAAAGERALEITARFQVCSDRICLRPQVAKMSVTVAIK